MSTCSVGTIQQCSVWLPPQGGSQEKGVEDETAHKAWQAEAVGPMTCVFILLNTSFTPGLSIFHAPRSHVHPSWSGC